MDGNRPGNAQQMVPVDPPPSRPQPRQPASLQGLLRFAMEATANEDVPTSSTMQPLEEERKRFLENAINFLSIDITRELKDAIELLSDESIIKSVSLDDSIPAHVNNAFECIESHISSIDTSIGYYNLGGFSVFPVCLSCENLLVQSAACHLLAELCQNNPFCQSKVLELGYLETLVNMLIYEQDKELLLKILYAMSCIIRHNQVCSEAFVKIKNVFQGLKNVLEKSESKLKAKASFLVSYLYSNHRSIGDELVSSGLLKALIKAVPKRHETYSEQILSALCVLTVYSNKNIMIELCLDEYNLKGTLTEYLESDDIKSEDTDYYEEKQYCETILHVIKNKGRKQKTLPDVDR